MAIASLNELPEGSISQTLVIGGRFEVPVLCGLFGVVADFF